MEGTAAAAAPRREWEKQKEKEKEKEREKAKEEGRGRERSPPGPSRAEDREGRPLSIRDIRQAALKYTKQPLALMSYEASGGGGGR